MILLIIYLLKYAKIGRLTDSRSLRVTFTRLLIQAALVLLSYVKVKELEHHRISLVISDFLGPHSHKSIIFVLIKRIRNKATVHLNLEATVFLARQLLFILRNKKLFDN